MQILPGPTKKIYTNKLQIWIYFSGLNIAIWHSLANFIYFSHHRSDNNKKTVAGLFLLEHLVYSNDNVRVLQISAVTIIYIALSYSYRYWCMHWRSAFYPESSACHWKCVCVLEIGILM